MLIKQLRWLRQGELESFASDVSASTEGTELTRHDDLARLRLLYVQIEPKMATENDTRVHRDPGEELLPFGEGIHSVAIGLPISEDDDLLDWDAYIQTPPAPSRSGTIKVRFRYVGRSKPIPVNDLWV